LFLSRPELLQDEAETLPKTHPPLQLSMPTFDCTQPASAMGKTSS